MTIHDHGRGGHRRHLPTQSAVAAVGLGVQPVADLSGGDEEGPQPSGVVEHASEDEDAGPDRTSRTAASTSVHQRTIGLVLTRTSSGPVRWLRFGRSASQSRSHTMVSSSTGQNLCERGAVMLVGEVYVTGASRSTQPAATTPG